METRPKTDNAKARAAKTPKSVEEHDDNESEEETSPNPATTTRMTRLRVAAAAQASARRNSATAAARRSLAKAKSANRFSGGRYNQQAVRRSSRTTPSSKKLEAEEQAAFDEKEKEIKELKALKRKFRRRYVMETNMCQYDYGVYKLSDIISVRGLDGNPYYAKIIGFFTNMYAERFVSVKWMLPKKPMTDPIWTKQSFNINMFTEGPVGDHLIEMEKIEYVHTPEPYTYQNPFLQPYLKLSNQPYSVYKDGKVINLTSVKPLSSMF